ncbi:N-6 DNA methylase [Rothia mucilaginosa]|uniref:type ISP restriction/modification enzyme n=1 Tax=Rothia mucilaginosa TaxID=43675 RepID=UPI001C5768DD|nr:type ISP restriction/modification enzyme [Rothia mucilaginosa]QXW98512.1 N-6 DNA methylase [Rothia mucilaginosa]
MTDFNSLIAEFGRQVRENLRVGDGEPEAQLTNPVATLLQDFGALHSMKVVTVRETSLKTAGGGLVSEGLVRPDYAIMVDGVLTGYVELKAPGKNIDPASFTKKSHEYKQWQRLRNLPNLLYTNGTEWRLYRYGEPVLTSTGYDAVHMHGSFSGHGTLSAPDALATFFLNFLRWVPAPIKSAGQLVETLAPLAALLREEMLLGLSAQEKTYKADQAKAKKKGEEDFVIPPPLVGLRKDWRDTLAPSTSNEEFADSFAQTVVFSLVVALSEGHDLSLETFSTMAGRLRSQHGLLGNALSLLTEHLDEESSLYSTLAVIVRVMNAASWPDISSGKSDVYLHLYEHFLKVYNPEQRKTTGSYYTPVEVVDQMVRLVDDALRAYLGKEHGLASEGVSVIDPAMGTGTYPLSVMHRVAKTESLAPAARTRALNRLAKNLYGFELQSGPFSVAELRLNETLKEMGADIPEDGLNLYVADTLSDPYAKQKPVNSQTLRLLSQLSNKATRVKREVPIQVCIGNPPYKDKAEGMGGWVESGFRSPEVASPILDDFRAPGMGKFEYVLKNLYVYFWRWAFWKVFEDSFRALEGQPDRSKRAGAVCFITASGYLKGPGFAGMREYIRRSASRGWIINVTPEGKRPPKGTAVFDIETPVSIALFLREENTDEETPADIRYVALHGKLEEKMQALAALNLDGAEFEPVRSGWGDKFAPEAGGDWDSYPELVDFYTKNFQGIKPNKTWVYAPAETVLQERWVELIEGNDLEVRTERFKETPSTSIFKGKKPLPGKDTFQGSRESLNDQIAREVIPDAPNIVPVGYRSFDRQYILADSRLLERERPELWEHRVPGQIFIVEQHAHYPKAGPGLHFSTLIPDLDAFNNRGGRAHPVLNVSGVPNLTEPAKQMLRERFGDNAPGNLVYYLAALTGHPGYVRTFDKPLQQAGIRVPLTADPKLWERAVQLGKQVVWLHTYGERGEPLPGMKYLHQIPEGADYVLPTPTVDMGRTMPTKQPSFLPNSVTDELAEKQNTPVRGTVSFGRARCENVEKRVFDYTVGGNRVLGMWAKYRLKKPKTNRSSSLNDIVQREWPEAWSEEYERLLYTLTHLVHLEPAQEKLLDEVLAGEQIFREEFVDTED